MRQFFANLILIALASAFLFHLIVLGIHGEILVVEPNTTIWVAELALVAGCLIFGFINLFRIAE